MYHQIFFLEDASSLQKPDDVPRRRGRLPNTPSRAAGQRAKGSVGSTDECTVPSKNQSSSELQAGKRTNLGSKASSPADVCINANRSLTFSSKSASKKK